jgi:hypothetical protein
VPALELRDQIPHKPYQHDSDDEAGTMFDFDASDDEAGILSEDKTAQFSFKSHSKDLSKTGESDATVDEFVYLMQGVGDSNSRQVRLGAEVCMCVCVAVGGGEVFDTCRLAVAFFIFPRIHMSHLPARSGSRARWIWCSTACPIPHGNYCASES